MTSQKLEQAALWILRRAPKRTFSNLVGWGSRVRFPRPVQRTLLHAFTYLFRIDSTEAEKGLAGYESLNDFFIRKLRPECRPVTTDEAVAVSPVDATLIQRGHASSTNLVQAKGIGYGIRELLGGAHCAERFFDGPYVTLYLKPSYYHRIHTPLKGTVREVYWVPGDRYPVTPMTVRQLPGLYNINERIVVVMETPVGLTAVIMVAALGVSNITLSIPGGEPLLAGSTNGRQRRLTSVEGQRLAKGDELGIFQLGSTVIVLFEAGRVELSDIGPGKRVYVGEPIARSAADCTQKNDGFQPARAR